jgi:hypothetical protein
VGWRNHVSPIGKMRKYGGIITLEIYVYKEVKEKVMLSLKQAVDAYMIVRC